MPVDISIKGLQEAQAANIRAINALKPTGALGAAVREALAFLHARAVMHTPHDTGALRASHRMSMSRQMTEGRIQISRTAHNPRSKVRPYEYGYYLHQRGHRPGLRSGWQDFYAYVKERYGRGVIKRAAEYVKRHLP